MRHTLRVLYVEENDNARWRTKLALETGGYMEVPDYRFTQDAVHAAGDVMPDIIILNDISPKTIVWETLESLRQMPFLHYTPAILLVEDAGVNDLRPYHDMGVCGVIPKPLDFLTLSQTVMFLCIPARHSEFA